MKNRLIRRVSNDRPTNFQMVWYEAKNYQIQRILNNLKNMHKSGTNDFNVFAVTLKRYQESQPTRRPFPYVNACYELKNITNGFSIKNQFHPT